MNFKKVVSIFVAFAALAYPQGATSPMTGKVADAQGALVPNAEVTVTNVSNGLVFKTTTSEKGEWALSSMQPAEYKVTITKPGFKTETVPSVVVNAGVPATIDVHLEVGQTSDTVVVEAAAVMMQTESATLSSTVQARQVAEIPFATRNAVELMVTQPGVATPTNPRSSSINGLPKGALNVTIDGMNTQDNLLKSSDGFFSYIYTPIDAVEEITLTTSATDAIGGGEGAANIKFVTRSGTNNFHGGVFWQNRNSYFNANYYFNNINSQPRDIINLNQFGGHVGGPIKKNKLFFFTNVEAYKLPNTYNFTRQVLTPESLSGTFRYKGSDGVVRAINLYDVAARANATLPAAVSRQFATTPDPIVLSTLQQIDKLTSSSGVLKPRDATNNDYARKDYNYQPHSLDRRYFTTARIDYNITSKHFYSVTYNYDSYFAAPDGLNSVVPIYAGTGTVLGSDVQAGQRSTRFVGIMSLRSVLTPHLTNEFRAGLDGGTVLFRDVVNASMFSAWRGYNPSFAGGYIAGVSTTTTPQRRNSPTKTIIENMTLVKGSHQIAFGGNFAQVNLFQSAPGAVNSIIPGITFGVSSIDPAFSGSTDMFTTANFPGLSSTDRTNAQSLYAILTGRVSSITQGRSLDSSGKYGQIPAIDRDRIRDYGLYVQDTWRFKPTLTIQAGLRYERQLPFENLSKTYTTVGYAGMYGISGIGNLFQPNATGGVVPSYQQLTGTSAGYSIPGRWLPSIGMAWQLPSVGGPLKWILGDHQGASVLRIGYAMNVVREGSNVFTSILGSNQGLNIDNSVDPSTFPQFFGPAGSAWFRDANLPSRPFPASPTFPIAPTFTTSLNDFNPNLKLGYVQSWNVGFQRELGKNTVIEFRYTGNHGTSLWRQYNLNEVNIVENGFLNEFNIAANNLRIARQTTPASNNWGNQGLPGQQALSIINNAYGNTTDATVANFLFFGQAGGLANAIATNATRYNNLLKANPKITPNFFLVNPTVAGGGSFIVDNSGSSYFNSGQVELRRRLSKGVLTQVSYVFSKSLVNGAINSSIDNVQPTTLRNLAIDRIPSAFDITHAVKVNGIWDLTFGPGRHFLGSVNNVIAKKALEGWQLAGNVRLQSGTPFYPQLTAYGTFNQYADGVVLHNMTRDELQSMIGNYKTTNANGIGQVNYLPDSVITNTKAAFNQGGLSQTQVDPNSKYIGPAPAGTIGSRVWFYLPWQRHFDFSLIKVTKLNERGANIEFRAQALNLPNLTNFTPNNNIGASFGQTTAAYRDTSGTVDPGGRILEFVFRLNF
ncbi:MAG TPA: TonB-dependent receptor [Bryobacteraceae bacterium]